MDRGDFRGLVSVGDGRNSLLAFFGWIAIGATSFRRRRLWKMEYHTPEKGGGKWT